MWNKLLIFTVMVVVLSANAWSDQVQPGKYTGTAVSIVPSANGNKWSADVILKDGYNIAKVMLKYSTYFEEWTWNGETLLQKEHDFSSGHEEITLYGATNDGGRYRINCQNRESGDCEAGIDPRHYWMITATKDGFIYEVWGQRSGVPGAAIKRHTLTFKLVK